MTRQGPPFPCLQRNHRPHQETCRSLWWMIIALRPIAMCRVLNLVVRMGGTCLPSGASILHEVGTALNPIHPHRRGACMTNTSLIVRGREKLTLHGRANRRPKGIKPPMRENLNRSHMENPNKLDQILSSSLYEKHPTPLKKKIQSKSDHIAAFTKYNI